MAINLSVGSKVAIGLISATGVAVGGYVTNEYLLGTKITELLTKDELVLLTKNQEEQWKKRWKEYVADNKNKWGLSDYETSSKNTNTVPENFKDTCIYKSSLRVSDNKAEMYKEVVDFCTKGFATSALIKKDTSIQLISEKTTPTGNDKWKTIWSKYFEAARGQNPLGLSLTNNVAKENVPTDYATKCTEKQNIEIRNSKDNNYSIVKNWCTEAKASGSKP